MISKRLTAGRLRLFLSVSVALIAAFMFPAPAHAIGDYIGVEAAPWLQDFSATGAIGTTTPGTEFDFADTLGLDDSTTASSGRVWVRLFGQKSRFVFDYADSSQNGSSVLTSTLDFNDITFGSGETINTDLDMTLLQAKYRYSFVNLKIIEVGAHLGANLAQVNMRLDGSVTGLSALDEDVPFPTVGGTVIVKPFPGFHIRAEIDGAGVSVSGNEINILDARVQVEYYFLHSFGIFAGYRMFDFEVDSDDFGRIDSSFEGAYAGLGLKF